MIPDDDERLRRYLLGELAQDEQACLEKALLADDEEFELLLAAEDDLIDTYVSGELGPDDQQRFEQRYQVTDQRWQRVELARDLRSRLALRSSSAPETPAAQPGSRQLLLFPARRTRTYLALAATIVLAVTTGLLGLRSVRLGHRLAALESERRDLVAELETVNRRQGQQRILADQLNRELAEKADQIASLEEQLTAAPAVAAVKPLSVFFLLSPAARSSGTPRLVLPPAAENVELEIDLDGEDGLTSVRARLRNEHGDEIWGQTGIEVMTSEWGRAVTVRLPAAILASGSYVLTVEGAPQETHEIGIYDFQVAR